MNSIFIPIKAKCNSINITNLLIELFVDQKI